MYASEQLLETISHQLKLCMLLSDQSQLTCPGGLHIQIYGIFVPKLISKLLFWQWRDGIEHHVAISQSTDINHVIQTHYWHHINHSMDIWLFSHKVIQTENRNKSSTALLALCAGNPPVTRKFPMQTVINSYPPSATYMHQRTGSAFVQIMASCLFGTKPLHEPMLNYC